MVYLGSDAWDGPRSLYDMFGIGQGEHLPRIKNYEIDLIEPYRMSEEEIDQFQSSMREVLLYLKYAEQRKKLVELAEQERFRNIDPVAVSLINEVTGSFIEISEEEEEINMTRKMCKAWQEISDEAREKGLAEGRAAGIVEGVAAGRAEEKRNIILNMISFGMKVADVARMTETSEDSVREWVRSSR